jgi:hypothetical protein
MRGNSLGEFCEANAATPAERAALIAALFPSDQADAVIKYLRTPAEIREERLRCPDVLTDARRRAARAVRSSREPAVEGQFRVVA